MGIYEQDPKRSPIVIKDVLVSSTDGITEVDIKSLPSDFKLGAVYLNQDDHAYARVRFDRSSIDWFVRNLHLIEDPLTRAEIWRYFWLLVREER